MSKKEDLRQRQEIIDEMDEIIRITKDKGYYFESVAMGIGLTLSWILKVTNDKFSDRLLKDISKYDKLKVEGILK